MSKWEYEGQDGEGLFLLTIRGEHKADINALPCVKAMQDTFHEGVVGRDQMDRSLDALSHRRWFPSIINFGGELIKVMSVFPFDGLFALSCKVLDGEHDAEAITAAVQAVNERAGV